MATAKKLPSGSWRCLVFSHYEDVTKPDGTTVKKRVYHSVTCDDPSLRGKKQCELEATEWSLSRQNRKNDKLTFRKALSQYIENRESVLSPKTIKEYLRSAKNDFELINDVYLDDLTQDMIQRLINEKNKECAPKTVRNMHGLVSAVLRTYRPGMVLNTSLPQKAVPNLYIPNDEEVKKLIDYVGDDNDMMIAILLAAFGPMRRSEICGLEYEDIVDGVAHIKRAVVLNKNNEWIDKPTKSTAGDRFIPIPEFVLSYLKEKRGRVIHISPAQVSDRFIDIQRASGMPHFRFHDLRHYSASIQHALNVPDAYIMQRGGWKSDAVLKQIYRHALSDKSRYTNDVTNNHFSNLMQHDMQHKK